LYSLQGKVGWGLAPAQYKKGGNKFNGNKQKIGGM